MSITRQAEIAIDILILCARNKGSRLVTIRLAAEHAGSTKDYTAQIVMRLVRAGYLNSERGRFGGISLARQPHEINVGTVLRLIDPVIGSVSEKELVGESLSFSELRRAAWEAYLSIFDGFTISDLVSYPNARRIGCLDCDLVKGLRQNNTLNRLEKRLSHSQKTAEIELSFTV